MDTSWVTEFKKDEQDYLDFYVEEVKTITLFFIYIDSTNNIEKCSRDIMVLSEKNVIHRDDLIKYIKHYNSGSKLTALFKYNVDLEPEEIDQFMQDDTSTFNSRFFTQEKYLNDITYKNTIHIFQDLNSLFFIYTAPSFNKTKNDQTKKTVIFSTKHKTRRNIKNKLKGKY